MERARIVLLASAGLQDQQIAAKLKIAPEKAARWRNRFLEGGLAALEKDAPRPGRTPTITPAKIQEVIRKTTREKAANATHQGTGNALLFPAPVTTTRRHLYCRERLGGLLRYYCRAA